VYLWPFRQQVSNRPSCLLLQDRHCWCCACIHTKASTLRNCMATIHSSTIYSQLPSLLLLYSTTCSS
jgi:hypothetical protein